LDVKQNSSPLSFSYGSLPVKLRRFGTGAKSLPRWLWRLLFRYYGDVPRSEPGTGRWQSPATSQTPDGRLIFGSFASIAEFEWELIRQRVRSGLAAAVVRGQRLGRPPSGPLSQEKAKQLMKERPIRFSAARNRLFENHLILKRCESGRKASINGRF
jgi:hypothetical protein